MSRHQGALSILRQSLWELEHEEAMRTQLHYSLYIYRTLLMGIRRSANTSRHFLEARHDSTTFNTEATASERQIVKGLMVRTRVCRT